MSPELIANIHQFYQHTELWRKELVLAGYEVEADTNVAQSTLMRVEWGKDDECLEISYHEFPSGEGGAIECWFKVYAENSSIYSCIEVLDLDEVPVEAMKLIKDVCNDP